MSQELPLVSIIIPSYNRSDVLRLCLTAVREQTYPHIEVIVVDDCGTEDAAQVAASMGATVLRTPVNGGPTPARNLGAEHATGEILLFLDADIALDPDAVENAVRTLKSRPEIGALGGILRPESLLSQTPASRYRAVQMHRWWMPTGRPTLELHASVLAVPAKVFAEIGPFDPRLRETVSADYRARVMRHYDVQLTGAVRGRKDHDATVPVILRKVFRRARISALDWRKGETPGDSVPRAVGGVLLLAAVPALALPAVAGRIGAAVPPALVAAAIALDAGTYRYAFAQRGVPFGLYFTGVHLAVTFTGALGGAVGVLQRLGTRE
ncbi:glycosyltransferase involved in cell wall biosynthesis [Thermocatellispora tengchongensis]|uniref:Glycosyltransferase involved in cell wall biosynthesis n=1 Tax=Thermocatellispora tengchongensis TaxID=1073253 RepID=A0A840P9I3_9ACTN|nr:glycosyltransferase family 2 protein [Thermocatellispora tengchongensis]MBB5134573.1 glycosyltransferase involved in cell wall biosynthesis [Thermocatellispora tengchongensis]